MHFTRSEMGVLRGHVAVSVSFTPSFPLLHRCLHTPSRRLETGALQFTGVATNPSPSRAPGGWNRGRKKADGACCERRPGGSNVVRVGAGPAFWRAVFLPPPCAHAGFGAPVLSTGAWLVFAPLSPCSAPLRSFVQKGSHRKASRRDGHRGVDVLIFTALIGRRPLLCVLALAAYATSIDA